MGFALADLSTGAIDPSTLQNAGADSVAAVHTGVLRVTLDTGSPIAEDGIVVPSLSILQSDWVMNLFVIMGGNSEPGAGTGLEAGETLVGTV